MSKLQSVYMTLCDFNQGFGLRAIAVAVPEHTQHIRDSFSANNMKTVTKKTTQFNIASDREVKTFRIQKNGVTFQGAHFQNRLYGLMGLWPISERATVHKLALEMSKTGLQPLITANLYGYRLWITTPEEDANQTLLDRLAS
ncbi:MAG: hypothetical protein AAGF66_16660 [Cyanobacteria bacterium P01_H01_bin.119]